MLSPGRLREAGLMEDVRSLRFSASAAPLHCQPVVTKLVEWRCQPVAQLYIDGLHFRQQEVAHSGKRAPELAFIERVDERGFERIGDGLRQPVSTARVNRRQSVSEAG